MPTFDYICEVCGTHGRAWRENAPPRFCGRDCQKKGKYLRSKPYKYIITPEMAARIREVYQGNTGKGQIRALAKALKLPRHAVSRYALKQGWLARTSKEPDWSERELRILADSAHRSPERIQVYLRRVGFTRSLTAIVLKRKRMRFIKNINGQSARKLSECFGVDVHCIMRWINLGYLRAMKRETHRTEKQGGDIWLIKDRWARDFIIGHVAEIDFRKVDKYWLVDLLAGGEYGTGASFTEKPEDREDPGDESDDVRQIFDDAANF